jgi:penicillin-binding protein A
MPETGRIAGTAYAARQRRRARARRRRLLSLSLLVAAAFLAGALVGADRGSAGKALALSFVRAWARGDYARMYADIDLPAQRAISPASFASDYRADAITATATALAVDGSALREAHGSVVLPVHVHTYLFGTLRASVRVPVRSERGRLRVIWSPALLFPGLRPGEHLTRRTWLPPRAPLLARDGSVLAEGSPPSSAAEGELGSPLGAAASAVVGTLGPIPASDRAQLEARGVPADAAVGTSGLERAFDARLRGRPGGELLAGQRPIATASAASSSPLRTSISAAVQRAASLALADQLGGVVALLPSRGEVLGVAGLGIDDVQPPGSTFKLVTLPAALEAGLAGPSTTFPYETAATLGGVELRNAGGESCGGTLAEAFAVSCNSVFAPLGAKLGSARLVAMAERLGFNHPPGLPGAAESTLPPASQIQGELDTGSTAIGQGEVLASPLQMALVAATIANGGRRTAPTFLPDSQAPAHGSIASNEAQVISPAVAHTETSLMQDVVRYGTGTAAAIPGVEVAGKTGTAELGGGNCGAGSSPEAASSEAARESCAAGERQSTDAWFAAFAPAQQPRIVVAVMLAHDGYGGETAAPVARQVIEAALAAGPQ